MTVDIAAATHAGHSRASNEDHVFVDLDRALVVVADGMGGETGGEIASAAACAAIDAATRDRPDLADALVAAATAVTTGGATVAAVQIANATAEIAHVGDVRVYVLRRGPTTLASPAPIYCPPVALASGATLVCATRDHSSICELVEHGHIDRIAAASHPLRSRVNRALGRSDPRADVARVPIVDGDRILVCTDGLWSVVSDDAIAILLERADTAHEAVESLIDSALSSGGPDNIGVAVVIYSTGDT